MEFLKQITCTLSLLFLTTLIFAQNSENSLPKSNTMTEKSPTNYESLGARIETVSITERKSTGNISGIKLEFKPMLSWKFSDDFQVALFPYFYFSREHNKGNGNSYRPHLYSYSLFLEKGGILKEDKHGVGLSMVNEFHFRPTQKTKERAGDLAHSKNTFYMGKNITDRFYFDNELQFHWHFISHKYSNEYTPNYFHVFLIRPHYKVASNVSLFLEVLQVSILKNDARSTGELGLNPGFKYYLDNGLVWKYQFEKRVANIGGNLSDNRLTGIRTNLEYKANKDYSFLFEVSGNLADSKNGGLSTRNFAQSSEVKLELNFYMI